MPATAAATQTRNLKAASLAIHAAGLKNVVLSSTNRVTDRVVTVEVIPTWGRRLTASDRAATAEILIGLGWTQNGATFTK